MDLTGGIRLSSLDLASQLDMFSGILATEGLSSDHCLLSLSSDSVTALATFALVLVTGFYAWLTRRLVVSQREQYETASMALLQWRFWNEDDATRLRLENVGESVILDIDVIAVLTPATDPGPSPQREVKFRWDRPWLPAKGERTVDVKLGDWNTSSCVAITQFEDVFGNNFAQLMFFECDGGGQLEPDWHPALPQQRKSRIFFGDIDSYDIGALKSSRDAKIGDVPVSVLTDRLKGALTIDQTSS